MYVLTLLAAAGSGLMAGAYFVFSVMVMRALGQLPPAQGIAAMQAINIAAIRPWFMTALFLPGLLSAVLVVVAIANWGESEAVYVLLGSVLYIAGSIVLTVAYHVPRNDRLAALDPDTAAAQTYWTEYLSRWTTANHVRTVASLGAAVLLTIALSLQ